MAGKNKGQNNHGTTGRVHQPKPRTAGQRLRDKERAEENERRAAYRAASLKAEQEKMNAIRAEFPERTLSDDNCRAIMRARQMASVAQMALKAHDVVVAGNHLDVLAFKWLTQHAGKTAALALRSGSAVTEMDPHTLIEVCGYLSCVPRYVNK